MRWLDLKGLARLKQAIVKPEINIPHRSARMEDGVLRTEVAGTDFVKGMTHDLHTPLNVIIGLCQLLERDRKTPLSPMQRDAVYRMERNAHSLLHTVDHLLACLRDGTLE